MESLGEKGGRLVVIVSTPMDRNNFWEKQFLRGRKESKMENELVPNNTTLAALRGLLREARKKADPKEAVTIELVLWHYDLPPRGTGVIKETIGVYRSGTGDGTQEFRSIKEARAYIESWKEESNGSNT